MKELFNKYKSVLRFLGLFFGVYLLLTVLYGFYLGLYQNDAKKTDAITQLVAKQTEALTNFFGYNAKIIAQKGVPYVEVFINDLLIVKIIEGCNGISIIILFIAFVISFYSTLKKTVLYLIAGISLLYAFNILRIALLSILLYHYPNQQEFLHTILFPLIIYGLVFLLWVIWIKIKVKEYQK